jgi:glycosyltransferase involved in cell wall biosynthesis
MAELDKLSISVVIPTYNNIESFENVIDAVFKQSVKPKQIVIIDSSDFNEIEINLHKYNEKIEIIYKKVERSFPGRARNLGVQAASEKYVAFLDSKTIPNKNWLSSSFAKLRDYDIVLGSVQYRGVSSFQKLISASIYGEDNIEHISGTLILKSAFLKIGFFNEKTRAGEDLDWRARVKESGFSYYVPSSANTIYSEISSNLIVHIKRAFVYQMHGAFMDIQHSTRVAFLGMFIILLATLAPSWNDLVANYNDNIFYIPHILKFFLFFFGLFVIVSIICLKLLLIKVRNRRSVIFLINLSLFIWFFIVVYHWNSAIPVWNVNSPFYIPHITKIYLASILVLSFITRGIIFPIKRGVRIKYLFPYRWVVIGLIGLILDISKSPGYFLGSLLAIYKRVKSSFRV